MRRAAEAPSPTTPLRPLDPRSRSIVCALAAAGLLAASAVRAQVGSPDPAFGGDGIVTTDLNTIDRAHDALARIDGTLIVVGETQSSTASSRNALLLEYGPDGTLVQNRTYFIQPGCNVPESLSAIQQEPDGGLLVGGYAQIGCTGQHQRDFWLLRLNADGSAALPFDRPTFYGNYDEIRDLAIQADGKIVAAGVATPSLPESAWNFALARYNADGTLDTAGFGADGEVVLDFAGGSDFALGVAIDAAGRIVVAGYAAQGGQRDIALARLLPDGTPDATFGAGGFVATDLAGFGDQANDVAVLPGGAIVVSGTSVSSDGVTTDPVVLRYQSDGSLDSTFGAGGVAVVDFGFRPAGAWKLLVQYDGKLVVTGTARTGAAPTARDLAVARLLPDGDPDPSFDDDGARTIGVVAGQEDVATGVALQPLDGHVVVAGYTVEQTGGGPLYDIGVVRLIGDAGLLIFADGFESGGTAGWSSAIPVRSHA